MCNHLHYFSKCKDRKDRKAQQPNDSQTEEAVVEQAQIENLIEEALVKKSNFITKRRMDMKFVKFNPLFSNLPQSRKRSKLQVKILAQYFK